MTMRTDLFGDLVVPDAGMIRDAMQAMQSNAREVVLVRDNTGRVVGLITDGDIRRGLLEGLTLESPVTDIMTRDFFAVSPDVDRAAALDLMKARQFQHIPVLDRDHRLVAVHFLHDLIGAAAKPNVAVVMAGGRGTRLRPFTEKIPKPMIEVAGRPMLERTVLHLVGHGVRKIYIAVNFMGHVIEDYFGDGRKFGCHIEYLREDKPLGTGGPLSLLPQRPEHPIFVLNGDLVTYTDLTEMLEAHVANGNAATVAVGPYQVEIPFGAVTAVDGKLVGIEEKPTINYLVNRGIYILDPMCLGHIPADQEFPITSLLTALLERKHPVGVFYFSASWLDVGRLDDLRRANGLD